MDKSIEVWIQKLKEKKMYLATGLELVSDRESVATFSFDDLADLFQEVVTFKKE